MAVAFAVALIDYELEERVYREHRDAFLLREEAFRRQYRLTKRLVRWLCGSVRGELTRVRQNTATSLTVEIQVLCALRFFATGSFQGMVATDEHLATSQSSVSRSIRAVAEAIVDCLGEEWISFPGTPAALAATKSAFARLDDRFDGCVGCVDGTLIAIQAPSSDDDDPDINKASYFCRKGFYALNVMVVSQLLQGVLLKVVPVCTGSVYSKI